MRRTARRLDAALAGGELVRAELRVPRFATVDLRGATVIGTVAVGKHLLTRMDRRGRAVTLHHHLRMDGTWRIGPPGPPRAPAHLIRVWLSTADQQAVGVHLHEVAVDRTEREHQWIGHLGPDILAEDFDAMGAAARVAASGLPLVEALLDQRVICGLGTMWASEAAHVAGANPFSAAAEVRRLGRPDHDPWPDARCGPVVTRRVPASLRVFERTGQPCRICGSPIRTGRVGVPPYDRPTYWCPSCQPSL